MTSHRHQYRIVVAAIVAAILVLPPPVLAQTAPAATTPSPAVPQAAPPPAAPAPNSAAPAAADPAAPPTTPDIALKLPRDLSPWGMFMAADIVVKAVMIGLAFASLMAGAGCKSSGSSDQ